MDKEAKPAATLKNEWVWPCPFCGTRNYYLADKCKKKSCGAKRVKIDGKWHATKR